MTRRLLAVLGIGIGIGIAPIQAAYHTLECVEWGTLSTGESFLQLQLKVSLAEGECWHGASCAIYQSDSYEITFYQHAWNDSDPPAWFSFPASPDSEFTSYYTAPHLWPNAETIGSVMVIERAEASNSLSATWCADSPTTGPGEFVIAQFTILLNGLGFYDLDVTSVIDPAPSVSGSGSYSTYDYPCGTLGITNIDFGPWTPGTTSTIARIPTSAGVSWNTAVIEGAEAANFAVGASPYPGDEFAVTFKPTAYGPRTASLVLTGTYQDPWTPEPIPWTSNIPLAGYGMCYGDFDGDARVGLSDLAILLANYGRMEWDLDYFDGNLVQEGWIERIDLADLAALLQHYGVTCE